MTSAVARGGHARDAVPNSSMWTRSSDDLVAVPTHSKPLVLEP
jgi:hypothetical protein